jgi:hypothetical protein
LRSYKPTFDAEGYVLEGKINQKAVMLETLSKRVVSLARVLHVHAASHSWAAAVLPVPRHWRMNAPPKAKMTT